MKQLLAIEYAKLKKLTSIKIIFLAYMIIIPLMMYGMEAFFNLNPAFKQLLISDPLFEFPQIWKYTVYSASFFNVLMGVTIVIVTCNEFQFKTFRQNVIEGMSKTQVITSKFLLVLLMSVMVTLYTFLVGFILGGLYSGFGNAYEGIHQIFYYLLQTVGYFSFAFLFAIIVRKSALSIVLFIIYFPIETIVGIFLPKGLYQFFPLKVLADLTPMPFFEHLMAIEEKRTKIDYWFMPTEWKIIISFAYVLLFFGLSYFILKKRDL
jgi:ABC-type transport system involved in multi-copper enzyme maturation permease subunit